MALFFIRAAINNGDGDGEINMDLFVHAKSPVQAVDAWKVHYTDWDTPKSVTVYMLCGATCGVGGTIPWEHIPKQEIEL